METSSKHIFCISPHLGNPEFPKQMTLPDIKHVELTSSFVFFQNLVGTKQLASPSVFKDFYDGGVLMNL